MHSNEITAKSDGMAENRISPRAEGYRKSHEECSANLLLAEHYRCPLDLWPFLAAGSSAKRPGYFRLGPDIICYGRLSCGDTDKSPDGDLDDALEHVRMEA